MRSGFWVGALALVTLATPACATVIDFSGLAFATNGAPLATYFQSGYTVQNTFGSPFVGNSFGNPTPSLVFGSVFGGPAFNQISLTHGGADFLLTSLDLSANGGPTDVTITGYSDAAIVYSFVLTPSVGAFFTTFTPGPLALTDIIRFSFNVSGSSSNLDNIVVSDAPVTGVPEPIALSLFGAGLAVAAAMRRRNKKA